MRNFDFKRYTPRPKKLLRASLTIATVRNNSDWLSLGNGRDNVCDLHLAGFSIDKNMSDCVLCFSTILKNDRNLVKSRSEFKVQEEILSFQFIVHETSPYICRSCVGKLRKRRGLYANVRKIKDELFSDYSSKAFKAGLTVKKKRSETLGKDSVGTLASPEKRILLEESVDRSLNDLSSLVTSTPVKAVCNPSVRKTQIPPLSHVRPSIMERSEGNDSGTENKTVLS